MVGHRGRQGTRLRARVEQRYTTARAKLGQPLVALPRGAPKCAFSRPDAPLAGDADYPAGSISSMPPMYGRKATGTSIVPSARW